MAQLFATFDDIKPYVSGANVNNDIATLDGYIATAAEQFMIPLLGRTFYDGIVERYNTDDLTADERALLPYLQRPLAHFGYYEFVKDSGLIVGDEGIGTNEAGNVKRPAQWQVRDFRRNRLKHGWSAMQALLVYLWEHKGDFEDWADSDERVDLWRLVIWDVNQWNKYRQLEGFGTLWALRSYTKATIEIEIIPNLGEDFAEEVLTWLETGDADADLTALLPYLERTVVFGSLYRAAHDLPLKITADGVFLDEVDRGLQNDETSKIAKEQLGKLAGSSMIEFNNSLARMRKYLDQNAAADKYATYFNSDLYNVDADSAAPPEELFTGPTFLM
jgi:hypothetical protein